MEMRNPDGAEQKKLNQKIHSTFGSPNHHNSKSHKSNSSLILENSFTHCSNTSSVNTLNFVRTSRICDCSSSLALVYISGGLLCLRC